MAVILTITLSPCIDLSISVAELVPEKKLRCSAPRTDPGGGGINVARVIHRLGGKAIAVYPSGGCTGKKLDQLLAKERVPSMTIETVNETRENIIVFEESTNKQFRFTFPGTELKESELERLLKIIGRTREIDFLVVSGTFPSAIPADIFSRLAKIASEKNAKIIVDTSGEALKHAVDHGVYLIKPNLSELASLAGRADLLPSEVPAEARKVIDKNKCEIIVVSLNAAGAILITKEKTVAVAPPEAKVKSTVGAGDSMVAGTVFALSKGKDIETAVKYGIACGTAATLNAGTELCHKEDAEILFRQIISESNAMISAYPSPKEPLRASND